jgi:hypothetical protein
VPSAGNPSECSTNFSSGWCLTVTVGSSEAGAIGSEDDGGGVGVGPGAVLAAGEPSQRRAASAAASAKTDTPATRRESLDISAPSRFSTRKRDGV